MEASSLFIGIAALVLLAVTSMRFGVDSRENLPSKERELAALGIVWGEPSTAPDRLNATEVRQARLDRQGEDCALAPC